MKKLGIILGLLIGLSSFSQETLFSCGEINQTAFNGWSIIPFKQFSDVNFDNNHLTIKLDIGGYYTIEMVRKIDELIGFDKLYLQLDYEKENVVLNSVIAQFSNDGKTWKNANNDSPFGPYFSQNDEMNDCYVKLKFDVQFFDNSTFTLKSVFIQGKYPETLTLEDKAEEIINPTFFKLFTFNNLINIETNAEQEYEVMIINLTGQVVHRAFKSGSSRIELNTQTGYYIVGLIVENQFVAKEKVYISSP